MCHVQIKHYACGHKERSLEKTCTYAEPVETKTYGIPDPITDEDGFPRWCDAGFQERDLDYRQRQVLEICVFRAKEVYAIWFDIALRILETQRELTGERIPSLEDHNGKNILWLGGSLRHYDSPKFDNMVAASWNAKTYAHRALLSAYEVCAMQIIAGLYRLPEWENGPWTEERACSAAAECLWGIEEWVIQQCPQLEAVARTLLRLAQLLENDQWDEVTNANGASSLYYDSDPEARSYWYCNLDTVTDSSNSETVVDENSSLYTASDSSYSETGTDEDSSLYTISDSSNSGTGTDEDLSPYTVSGSTVSGAEADEDSSFHIANNPTGSEAEADG